MRLATRADSSKPTGALEEPRTSNGAEPELIKRFGERLAAETDGQPFYVVETIKALLEEGKLLIHSPAEGEQHIVEVVGSALRVESSFRGLLPQSVREVIHARLSRLSAAASELLRAGAVLERGFGFEVVSAQVCKNRGR